MSNPLFWKPTSKEIQKSRLSDFANEVGFHGHDFEALYRWSIENREEFWRSVWHYTEVQGTLGLTTLNAGDDFVRSKWFIDSTLNFASNLMRYNDDRIALVAVDETGKRTTCTFAELNDHVKQLAAYFLSLGLEEGDRVAGYLTNSIACCVAMLATAQLGAIWTSCSPDFGVVGALDRFGQIAPKLLVACEAYTYGGKHFDVRPAATEISKQVSSIEKIVWVSSDRQISPIDISSASGTPHTDPREYPFNHPLYVMYSSGTTGKPKCIVHGAGGTLLQHLKEHQLHIGLTRDDVLFFYTTTGWMMWNWLMSSLATGCTLILYDGAPFFPDDYALLNLIDSEGITHFGVGAKYLSSIEKRELRPKDELNLASLTNILSTGSPLSHESFDYVYGEVKSDVRLASISGGTDLLSCFVLGNPWSPVFRGEIQGPGLGMDIDVVDDRGQSITEQKGELICRSSFPSKPLRFWDDPEDALFRRAYFQKFENIWVHGDFAEKSSVTNGYVIHGRSDAVLNPGGVRIGTAEIYRQLEPLAEIQDGLCVEQEWEGDTRVVLFVVLREGISLDDNLKDRIKRSIRRNASPRHVPAKIIDVPAIPLTRSGKIAEIAVRDVVHGRKVTNATALSNPECLDHFRNRKELLH